MHSEGPRLGEGLLTCGVSQQTESHPRTRPIAIDSQRFALPHTRWPSVWGPGYIEVLARSPGREWSEERTTSSDS